MEFWHGFLLITSVHLLAAASPGPDFVLVSQQTLAKGRRTGLICSFGITLGLAVHIIYSVLGLATVIAHSQPLLTAIKWLGGSYLIPNPTIKVAPKHEQLTTEFFVAV